MFHVNFFPANTWLVTPSSDFFSHQFPSRFVLWFEDHVYTKLREGKGESLLEEVAHYWKHGLGSVDRLKVKQTLRICSVHYGERIGWLHTQLGLYAFVYI